MKKYFYILLTITLLLSCIIISQNHSLHHIIESLNNNENENEAFMEKVYLLDNIAEGIANNGSQVLIDSLKTGTPKLVCIYSAQSCGSCVSFAQEKLEVFFPKEQYKDQTMYIVSGYNSTKIFNKSNTINIRNEKIGGNFQNSLFVYYCIIDKDRIEHVFIPDKTYEKYTDTYLEMIKNKYFNLNNPPQYRIKNNK